MIQEKMRALQTSQKSYHDKHRKALEFQEGDYVFLRITLVTGVGKTLKSRKLIKPNQTALYYNPNFTYPTSNSKCKPSML